MEPISMWLILVTTKSVRLSENSTLTYYSKTQGEDSNQTNITNVSTASADISANKAGAAKETYFNIRKRYLPIYLVG